MNTITALQKEFKAMASANTPKSAKTFMIDVYCDRVIVLGYQSWLEQFFHRRQVVADMDRGGWAISIKDAQKLGLMLTPGTHHFQFADLRKKAEVQP